MKAYQRKGEESEEAIAKGMMKDATTVTTRNFLSLVDNSKVKRSGSNADKKHSSGAVDPLASTMAITDVDGAYQFYKRHSKVGGGEKETEEVDALKEKLHHNMNGGSQSQRNAFDLKMKLEGLLLAVKDVDGTQDEMSTPPSSREGAGAQRSFGGAVIKFSHRTATLGDKTKVAKTALAAALIFKKKLDIKKHHAEGDADECPPAPQFVESEHNDNDQDGLPAGTDVDDTNAKDGTTMRRRVSMAFQPEVEGKARKIFAERVENAQPLPDEEEDDLEDTKKADPVRFERLTRAIFGSEAAYRDAKQMERVRALSRERMRDPNRAMSITDAALLGLAERQKLFSLSTSTVTPPESRSGGAESTTAKHFGRLGRLDSVSALDMTRNRWARENDPTEMYAEFISCVRGGEGEWRSRFISERGTLPSSSQSATIPGSSSSGDNAFRRPHGSSGSQGEENQPSIAGQNLEAYCWSRNNPFLPTPRSKKPITTPSAMMRAPPVNTSALNKMLVDLMKATAKPNTVNIVAREMSSPTGAKQKVKSFVAAKPKYRCPHCHLLPEAGDNHSLLSQLHSLAVVLEPNTDTAKPTSSLPEINDNGGSDDHDKWDDEMDGISNEDLILGINFDTRVYTGLLPGPHNQYYSSLIPRLPRELPITLVVGLDKQMWKLVGLNATKERKNASSLLDDCSAQSKVGGGGGGGCLASQPISATDSMSTEAFKSDRDSAAALRNEFQSIIDTESEWKRQSKALQIRCEKDLSSLSKLADKERKEYTVAKSKLRTIQMDLIEAESALMIAQKKSDKLGNALVAQSELTEIENEMERLTVELCDLEVTRRGLKKNLSKVVWTSHSLKEGYQQLVDIRSELMAVVSGNGTRGEDILKQFLERDVARPLENTDVAAFILGNGIMKLGEMPPLLPMVPRPPQPREDDAPSPMNAADTPMSSDVKHSRSKRNLNVKKFQNAVKKVSSASEAKGAMAERLSTVMTHLVEVRRTAEELTSLVQSVLSVNQSQSADQSAPPAVAAQNERNISLLLGPLCPHCDHYIGSSKFCGQTGDLHESLLPAALASSAPPSKASPMGRRRSSVSFGSKAPLSQAADAPPLPPSFLKLMCTSNVLQHPDAPRRIIVRPFVKSEGDDNNNDDPSDEEETERGDDMGALTPPQESFAIGDRASDRRNTQHGKPGRRDTRSGSRASYVERKTRKSMQAQRQRRSSVALARQGSKKWLQAAQQDSSSSDSELEYADFDKDSDEEEVAIRRKSVAMLLGADEEEARTAGQSNSRKMSFFVDPNKNGGRGGRHVEDKEVHDAEDALWGAGRERQGSVYFASASVNIDKKSTNAVRERLTKRKKLRDQLQRAAMRAFKSAAFSDAQNDDKEAEEGSRRVVDLAVTNVLTMFIQELRGRMLAPLHEGLPPASLFDIEQQSQGQGSGSSPNRNASMTIMQRKYLKAQSVAKAYEGGKPIPGGTTGAGAAAASTAAASGAVAVGGLNAPYLLIVSPNAEVAAPIKAAEESFAAACGALMNRIHEYMYSRHTTATKRREGRQATPSSRQGQRKKHSPSPKKKDEVPAKGAHEGNDVKGGKKKKKKGEKSVVAGEIRVSSEPVPPPSAVPTLPTLVAPPSLHSPSPNKPIPTPPPLSSEASRGASQRKGSFPRGAPTQHPAATPESVEKQLLQAIEQIREAVALSHLPAREILLKVTALEKANEDLTKQIKAMQQKLQQN